MGVRKRVYPVWGEGVAVERGDKMVMRVAKIMVTKRLTDVVEER